MEHPKADDYEAQPGSIEIDIVDEQGHTKENYVLLFQDHESLPQTVKQERERFANDPANANIAVGNIWVIVKNNGAEIPMEEGKEVLHYHRSLQNSYILTRGN